jgi:VWFA-related protein
VVLRPLAAALVLFPSLLAQERRDVPTFSSRVELVTVDAVVLDRKGEPVRGLTAQDFALFEDGQLQEIASFEAFDLGSLEAQAAARGPSPVATNVRGTEPGLALPQSSFVLLVDDMSLAPAGQETVRTAIVRFVSESLRDGDDVIFATTSGDAWWSTRMPEGRDDLIALAARVRGRALTEDQRDFISEWEAYRISTEGAQDLDETGASGPPGVPATAPGTLPRSLPGANATRRVVDRYYLRRVCDPDPPAPTPYFVCRSMALARARLVDQRRINRTRDALAAVDRAVFALTGVRGRKSLLFLTEGFLNDPNLDVVREVTGRCREANIVVYALDVRGLLTGMATADQEGTPNATELAAMRAESIELHGAGSVALAEETGGFAVRNTNDLAGGAARVADESRTYYLLGYAPPEGKGPRDWRRLRVEVKREGLKVRARRGYTLRTSAEIAAATEARLAEMNRSAPPLAKDGRGGEQAPVLPVDVVRALANGRDAEAIPLRAMVYALDGRPGATVRSLVVVEIDTRSLANLAGLGRGRAVLALSLTVTHRDTGKTQRIDQRVEAEMGGPEGGAGDIWRGWLVLSRDFDLPPGVAQARIVVRDEFLGRLGALNLRFLVPSGEGLRISTALLTDRLAASRPGEPLRPALVAHRDFAPGRPLYCQFQVFGRESGGSRATRIAASYELRHRDGSLVRRSEPGPMAPLADGRWTGLMAVDAAGIAAGDYDLVLRIADEASGEVRERIEPFRIVRGEAPAS